MPVQWIQYAGKKILYADFTGVIKAEDLLRAIDEMEREIKFSPGKLLILQNFTDAYINSRAMEREKEIGKAHAAKVVKSAFLGIIGVKKILLSVLNRATEISGMAFETKEEALKYLVGR